MQGHIDNGDDASPSIDNWTDALSVCNLSGIGTSPNQIYREDGTRVEEHKFEDHSFRFCPDGERYLYGIVDGHDGDRASHFVYQRLPAELLLDQLDRGQTAKQTCDTLSQAFVCVEQAYLHTLQELLAERTSLLEQIPEAWSPYDVYRHKPQLGERLKQINHELSSGATVVLALVHSHRLFVANVGTCRALLCRTDDKGDLRVIQLTVDHSLQNDDEKLRLRLLGIPDNVVKGKGKIGNDRATRKLGDYTVKGGYKEIEELRAAVEEPVIAEPEIHGGLLLDHNCRFLMLVSSGLIQTLEEVLCGEEESVNRRLTSVVAQQFYQQHTLVGVAQAAVDHIVRLHHDAYMMRSREQTLWCRQREDITLLVRNFNYPLGVPATPLTPQATPDNDPERTQTNQTDAVNTSTNTNTVGSGSTDTSTSQLPSFRSNVPLPLDSEGRVEAYVDFTQFYAALAEARSLGQVGDEVEEEEEDEVDGER